MQNKMLPIIGSFLLIVILAVAMYFYVFAAVFTQPYALSADDIRSELFWSVQYKDATLLQDDFYTEERKKSSPLLIHGLYYCVGKLNISYLDFAKVFPVFILLLSLFFLYATAIVLKDYRFGFLLCFMFLWLSLTRTIDSFYGTASYIDVGILLIIMFFYFVIKKKHMVVVLLLILQLLTFPPFFLVLISTYVAYLLLNQEFALDHGIRHKILEHLNFQKYSTSHNGTPAFSSSLSTQSFYGSVLMSNAKSWLKCKKNIQRIGLVSGVLFSVGILFFIYFINKGTSVSLIPPLIARNIAEYHMYGRVPLYLPNIFLTLMNSRSGFNLQLSVVFFLLLAFSIALIKRKKISHLPLIFHLYILISFGFIIMAQLIFPYLHQPEKYMRFALPFYLLLFVAINIFETKWYQQSKKLRVVWYTFFFSISFLCLPLNNSYIAQYPLLNDFFKRTPKQSMVAGHPFIMDDVIAFSHRKILVGMEGLDPLQWNIYSSVRKRTYAFFRAYYCQTKEEFLAFCKKYNITHFIVDTTHFEESYFREYDFPYKPFTNKIMMFFGKSYNLQESNGKRWLFYEPFNTYIWQLIDANKNKKFYLKEIGDDKKKYINGNIFVIDCRNL